MASVTVFRSRPKARPPIRKPLNCESCRHIKQKCDRSRPCCSNCQQRGIKCHYATTANSRSEQRRSGDGDEQLRERVKALEAALELSEQSSNHTRLPISPSTSSRHTSEDDFGTGVFDDMLSTGSTSSSVPSSVLRCDINKAPASNNLSILAVSGLPDAPPSRLLVSSDHASKGSSNASLLLFPCSSVPTKADLLKLLPGVSLCDTLLARYFKTFGPLFHILHEPSFKMEYGSFLCNMQGVDLSWLSLFNVLLALSITTLDDGDPVMEELNTGRDVRSAVPELSAHFRGIAISCLAADDFLVHHNLHTLEALVLLLYAMGHSGSPGTFPLLGLTVNTAISLRCHLDENDASCITRELKRRCWAGILMLHTIQAVSLDNIDVQSLTSYQVPLPCDVNDVDIQIHGISPASSSPTQNSYMLYKYRLYGYAARISKLLSSRNATTDYADFHALDHEIALEQQVWDERWLSDARNDSVSRCQAQLFILNMYANQLYLLLHRPFFNSADGTHARTNETNYQARSQARCVSSAQALIDIYTSFCEIPSLKTYKWFKNGLGSFYAVHGAMTLAAHLMRMDLPAEEERQHYLSSFERFVQLFQHHSIGSVIATQALPALMTIRSKLAAFEQDDPQPSLDDDIFRHWDEPRDWLSPSTVHWVNYR